LEELKGGQRWYDGCRVNPMNVIIRDLPESVVTSYEATARSRGISLDAFLREYLIQNARSTAPGPPSADEWEKALDDCIDSFPSTSPSARK
jgi:hypothetical protein